ncbi:hypothetical protein [Delftia phage PhiW-14]|uniref:Uncharacterized protein n=1 Tax=Delftia phage PhiW-14 TaxID=665032 RepID=C9DGB5_BPW14|nr:hypothetical protein DP-phiW-14_gp145 [Delftia phage PhiW-14]ACV50166.1 hypothetical protein [Delftia phage PhiW-14]
MTTYINIKKPKLLAFGQLDPGDQFMMFNVPHLKLKIQEAQRYNCVDCTNGIAKTVGAGQLVQPIKEVHYNAEEIIE